VQGALAEHADELVRTISRQWAVHGRMTAVQPPVAACGAGATACPQMPRPATTLQSEAAAGPGGSSTASSRLPACVSGSSLATPNQDLLACRRINPMPVLSPTSSTALCGSNGPSVLADTHGTEAVVAAAEAGSGELAAKASSKQPATVVNAAQVSRVPSPIYGLAAAVHGHSQSSTEVNMTFAAQQGGVAAALDAYVVRVLPMLSTCDSSQYSQDKGNPAGHLHDYSTCNDAAITAMAAAHVLLSTVANGCAVLLDVELALVHRLEGSRAARDDESGSQHDQPIDITCVVPATAKLLHAWLLLAAAVVCAVMSLNQQNASTWQPHTGMLQGRSDSMLPPRQPQCMSQWQLPQLSFCIMRHARCNVPVWLLHQMRAWLQASTIGCGQTM
jgi:hypothetical protein